jgi:1,4-alpha-glucan branching enzyme
MTVGTFCLVLHSHLPWVAHHGTWPVGEEWLYQAWTHSYLPVVEVAHELAERGHSQLFTLGITPILAAQLDDPYLIAQERTWLADWLIRATGSAASADAQMRVTGQREFHAATGAIAAFEQRWSRGGSPVFRELHDGGVIEILGGPLTHPFQPLLDDRIVLPSLVQGLADTRLRLGHRPAGIWAPECGYRPGMEQLYQDAGVEHFLVDGPTLASAGVTTAQPWRVGASDVVAFGRDLDVTYRVWSPRRGYPGGRWYRDFHTFDHTWGLRPSRVTSTRTDPQDKAPYQEEPARAAVAVDAADFVAHVVRRCQDLSEHTANPVVVAAYDTELFGHWWHEGPAFLSAILELLPKAGVEVTTLSQVTDRASGSIDLASSSWGSGKDWRVWDGAQVEDISRVGRDLQHQALTFLRTVDPASRDLFADQVVRELLLALSSDWAFMVTKDSAAEYARQRFTGHANAVRDLLAVAGTRTGVELAQHLREIDGPFGHLDARQFIP